MRNLSNLEQAVLTAVDGSEMWKTLSELNVIDRTSGKPG